MAFLEKLQKMWENRDIKLLTTQEGRNYLVSEPNSHTTKLSSENLIAMQMKKLKYLWINLFI